MKKNLSGFTIVELLIVIVVIGILSAITVVAYNGLQQRARNQQTVYAVNAYTKAILQYATVNGTYPINRSPLPCLGVDYTCDNTNDGSVSTQAMLTDLSPYMQSVPQPATSTRVYLRTGALYAGNTDADRYILFIQENQTACPAISGLTQRTVPDVSNGNLVCRFKFPAL